jgi:MFS family permease
MLILFRVILGAGIGIISVVCPLYVAETAPSEKRGRFGILFQVFFTGGVARPFCLLKFRDFFIIPCWMGSGQYSKFKLILEMENHGWHRDQLSYSTVDISFVEDG